MVVAYFYVLIVIPLISAIKTHLFVTCATVRIRAGQFNFEQPVSECQNLTCSEANILKIMMHNNGSSLIIFVDSTFSAVSKLHVSGLSA